jgi:hypothetical protein
LVIVGVLIAFGLLFFLPSALWMGEGGDSTSDGPIDGEFDDEDEAWWQDAEYIHAQYFVPYNLSALWDIFEEIMTNYSGPEEFIEALYANWSAGVDIGAMLGITFNGTEAFGGNLIAYNWIHVRIDDEYIYVFLDLCSQTVADYPHEWFWLSLDTDGTQDVLLTPFQFGNGNEWIFFNATGGTNSSAGNLAITGDPDVDWLFNSTINGSDVLIMPGFGTTMHSATPHRFFEVRVARSALGFVADEVPHEFNASRFGIQFTGGVGAVPISDGPPDYYALFPALSLPFCEFTYFLCGDSIDGYAYIDEGDA